VILIAPDYRGLQASALATPDRFRHAQHNSPYMTEEGTNQLDLLQMEGQLSYQDVALTMVVAPTFATASSADISTQSLCDVSLHHLSFVAIGLYGRDHV